MSHGHDSSIPFWVQKVQMTVAVIGVDEGINSRNHMDNDIESLGNFLKIKGYVSTIETPTFYH